MDCRSIKDLGHVIHSYKHEYLWVNIMAQDQNSTNIALSYNYWNDIKDTIPVLTLKLESQSNVHVSADNASKDNIYEIATTYSDSSILICDTNPLLNITASISITYSAKIEVEMTSILQLANTFNDFRKTSFIFVKGTNKEIDRQLILVHKRSQGESSKVTIYDVPSDSEHLSYVTAYNRWIYRITNPNYYINENNIFRTYDHTLQNDDFVELIKPMTIKKSFKVDSDIKFMNKYYHNFTFSYGSNINVVTGSDLSRSYDQVYEDIILNLELQDNLIRFNAFEIPSGYAIFNQS